MGFEVQITVYDDTEVTNFICTSNLSIIYKIRVMEIVITDMKNKNFVGIYL